ncbi:helix-turn-helix transcriptional regulator, partial [Rhodopirellula bahusiensis]
PIKYLIQVRIQEASRLLRSTDRSITDIAFDVGFSDSNYFSRQFRTHLGLSPREYRKQMR